MEKMFLILATLLVSSGVCAVGESGSNGNKTFGAALKAEGQKIEAAKKVAAEEKFKYSEIPLAVVLVVDNKTDKKIRFLDISGIDATVEAKKISQIFIPFNFTGPKPLFQLIEDGNVLGSLRIVNNFKTSFDIFFKCEDEACYRSLKIELPHAGKKNRLQVLFTLEGDDLSASTLEFEGGIVGDSEEVQEEEMEGMEI